MKMIKKNHNFKESEQKIKIYHKFYLIVNDYESEKNIYKKNKIYIYHISHAKALNLNLYIFSYPHF